MFNSSQTKTMVEAVNLEKRYFSPDGSFVTALRLDRFVLGSGDRMAVVGPSGSGKSTLFSLLGGVTKPTGGNIRWNGEPWPGDRTTFTAQARARRVGFIFQDLNLLPSLSLYDNLATAAWFLGLGLPDKTIPEVLDCVGLSHRHNHKPDQLSRGEQQRAAIARAMLYPHPLILADEPTASLDEDNALLVTDLLLDMAADNSSALLVATHDPRIMEKLPLCYVLPRQSGDKALLSGVAS